MDEKKLEETGKKLQKIGCLLTVAITVPIVLTVLLGVPGLIIGIIIAVVAVASMLGKKEKPKKEG